MKGVGSILPPLPPPPPTNAVLWWMSSKYRDWLTGAMMTAAAADELILEALGAISTQLEKIVATNAELQATIDANTVATQQAWSAMQVQIQQLATALSQLSTASPPTQEQLDQINANTAKLQELVTAAQADDTAPPAA